MYLTSCFLCCHNLTAIERELDEEERLTHAAEAGLLLEAEFYSSKRVRVLKLCDAFQAHLAKTVLSGPAHQSTLLNEVRDALSDKG
jgi:hypothetical protein